MKKVKVELIFPKNLKDEQIICSMCKKFGISFSIIEASFSTELGWAILKLEGQSEDLKQALDYVNKFGVEIKDTRTLQ